MTVRTKTRRIIQWDGLCKGKTLNLEHFVTIIPNYFDQTDSMRVGTLMWLCVVQKPLEYVLANIVTIPAYVNSWGLLF